MASRTRPRNASSTTSLSSLPYLERAFFAEQLPLTRFPAVVAAERAIGADNAMTGYRRVIIVLHHGPDRASGTGVPDGSCHFPITLRLPARYLAHRFPHPVTKRTLFHSDILPSLFVLVMQSEKDLTGVLPIRAVVAGPAAEGRSHLRDLVAYEHLLQVEDGRLDPGVTAGIGDKFDVELELSIERGRI